MGLAHGPENQFNQANGYIFPEFGHGYNDICGEYDDLMSYGFQGYYHSTETKTCDEIFDDGNGSNAIAGNRQFSDTTYALNRVRYEVSLINDENKYVDEELALRTIIVEAQRIQIEVID